MGVVVVYGRYFFGTFRGALLLLSDRSGGADPLLAGRRDDQVHGSHSAGRLLSAECRCTANTAQLLRHTTALVLVTYSGQGPSVWKFAPPPTSAPLEVANMDNCSIAG